MVEHEYAFIYLGGESGRPWGTKGQGHVQAPHLNTVRRGIDIVNVELEAGEETGNNVTLTVGTVLVPNEWKGAQLRLGTTDAPLAGYFTITSNTASTVTGNWIVATAAGPATIAAAYIVRTDLTKFPDVRVLMPYQPEVDAVPASGDIPYPTGTAVAPPGFTLPAGITSYADQGLFLPFAFEEGIGGAGLCELTDSYAVPAAHAMNGVAALLISHNFGVLANSLAGGYVRATHEGGVSWAQIDTHDGAGLIALVDQGGGNGWLGAGLPTFGGPLFPLIGDIIWEAWIPHWSSSPNHLLPGVGFRYPSNDMQPGAFGDGRIRNLPRGVDTSSYLDTFGSMIEFGFRMRAALGKRVNMIPLAINSSTLLPNNAPNLDGFQGTLGWWDHNVMTDWSPSKLGGLAARIENLITTVAPAALLAEGSTKVLRIMGIVMQMGDGDVVIPAGRESYGQTYGDFVEWLRGVIATAGLSPYDDRAKIPVVHPLLTEVPWAEAANDPDHLVNGAVLEVSAADGFSATIDSADSPKLQFDDTHFNGVGEALNGNLIALAMNGLVDMALSFGSSILTNNQKTELQICNRALALIGERKIDSLDPAVDVTHAAYLCSELFPEIRETVIGEHAWGFALRRVALVPTPTSPTSYLHSYVLPEDALRVIAVLPANANSDHLLSWHPTLGIWESQLGQATSVGYAAQAYGLEQSPSGHRILVTNTPDACLRYVSREAGASRYPPEVRKAISYALAAELSGAILKDPTATAQWQGLAEHHLGKAIEQDANQTSRRYDPVIPYIAARF